MTTAKTTMSVSIDRLGSADYNAVKNITNEIQKLDRTKYKHLPKVVQAGKATTIETNFFKESRNGEAEKIMFELGLSHDVISLFNQALSGNANAIEFGSNDNYEPVFVNAA